MKSGERRAQSADSSEGLLHLALIVLLIALPIAASACPVCYGTQQTPLTKSAGNGILFLLGIVGSVQVGFVALFISFWRRTKALQQKREQFQIIEGGKER
jgi:hypothetical protein